MAEHVPATWLAGLPEIEPPESLWPRIDAARRRQRLARWLAPSVAATVAALGLGLALLVAAPPQTQSPVALDALIENNHLLAETLQAKQAQAAALADWQAARIRSLESDLTLLDRRLQARYVSSGQPSELEALWRARADLLASMIETYEQPRYLRRI